jgi:hypothetical protein
MVARNVAASLGRGTRTEYKHDGLGFLVDLGGLAARREPLNVPLSGPAANALTRGYHLYSMSGNRMRVVSILAGKHPLRLGLTAGQSARRTPRPDRSPAVRAVHP